MNDVALEALQFIIDLVQTNRCSGADHRDTSGRVRTEAVHAAIQCNKYTVDINNGNRTNVTVSHNIAVGKGIVRSFMLSDQ